MRRKTLARALVEAATAAERRRLLAAFPRLADGKLADEIRKICYAAWTSDPAMARPASRAADALAKVDHSDDVRAAACWIAGIAAITEGKFDLAVERLGEAREVLAKLGRRLESAQTLVPTLLALAVSGRSDEAVKAGKAALRTFRKEGDDLAAGKIEMNLSNIAGRRFRLREAERHAIAALRSFENCGEKTWQAMAQNGLALTYMDMADLGRAEHFFALALETARAQKMRVTEAEIEASMGNLAALRGNYADGLRHLELSRRKFEALNMPHQTVVANLEIADIYASLNLHAEAYEIYRSVSDSFRRLKMLHEEARSRHDLGRTSAALGHNRAARREFERATRLFASEGNSAGLSSVLLSRASLELSLGRHARVSGLVKAARESGRESPRHMLAADLVEGRSLYGSGELAAAERLLKKAAATALVRGELSVARSAEVVLGEIAADRGDLAKAQQRFLSAIDLTDKMRGSLAAPEFGLAFITDKLDAYEGLMKLYIARQRYEDAFITMESSRSRSLLNSMATGKRREAGRDHLSKRLGDLRAELNWFYKRLDQPHDADQFKKEIAKRERSIADVARQIGSLAGQGSSGDHTIDLARLHRQLGRERTLVEYAEVGSKVSAFVVGRGVVTYFPDLCSVAEIAADLEDLQFQFGACRLGPAIAKFRNELKRRADRCLARLYDRLLRPLEHLLSGSEIVFAPCGGLNFVPFHALVRDGGYIVERFEVVQTPGASVWSQLQKRRRMPFGKALLVGSADERIPLVEKEIEVLQKRFTGSTTLKGKEAGFAAFSSAATGVDVIHLACHGQFRLDNPMYSSLHLADGWMIARDLLSLRLRASLVTLSACESGMTHAHGGNEPLGLVWGFLAAGAASLIVSLWTVNDASAAELMGEMYDCLQRALSPAASLRIAQLKFIERGEHPYYWSPFVAIGK